MSSDWENGLPVNILRGLTPTAESWDGVIGFAFEDDGGAFTDETVDANDAGGTDVDILPLVPAVNDAFYFGENFATSGPFNHLKIDAGQLAIVTTGAGVWEYYDVDTTWKAIPGLVDETSGFTVAGAANYVYWTEPATWTHVAVNGQDRYWVRFRCTDAGYTQQPKVDQIWLGRYPTSLSNITDGNNSTSSDIATVQHSAGGTMGYLTVDLGMEKTVLVGAKVGVSGAGGTITLYAEAFAASNGTPGGNEHIISQGVTTELIHSSLTKIYSGRYLRFRFISSAAMTASVKIYSIFAYELSP